jgi:hypothetical protein
MESRDAFSYTDANNIELAKRCLSLIRDIAGLGACSRSPEQIGYALQELTQVLVERTGTDNRLFEPIPADEIRDLPWLHEELALVDSFSQSMAASRHSCGFVCLWIHRSGFSLCGCEESRTSQASGGTWN